ncbi:nucleotidyltransferase family protein [Aphanothece sacrum]|uniref:nucleotidyltransferase family protein n=1 Tax=Aphanothece sacrum TaxID=1122 RepID=UPI000F60ECDF|nr:nucleotidyltransferase domain-containing protein [Aphanothece sacrum]
MTDFCNRWNILEFALFGSVLRDNFRPDSDIDCLIITSQNFYWTIDNLLLMEEELEKKYYLNQNKGEKFLNWEMISVNIT